MFTTPWERVFSLLTQCELEGSDALSYLLGLAEKDEPSREAALRGLAEEGVIWLLPGDISWNGFLPADIPASALSSANKQQLKTLLDTAVDVADGHHLGQLPHPSRKEFLDALEAVVDTGVLLADASYALFLARPEGLLPLVGPMLEFLSSPDGLGIAPDDLPATARDYLELVMFLNGEMEQGNLPYRDFLQMARAVGEGRTLAQGLSSEDRRSLAETSLRPALRRLFPRDPDRVEAEVARLLEA